MRPVDVEGLARTVLASLGVPVSTRVPSPRPVSLVRVTRAGGSRRNLVQSDPLLLVECWAPDSVAAFDLARDAWSLIDQFPDWSASLSEPVNFPDPDSGSPRYQFTASLILNLEESA